MLNSVQIMGRLTATPEQRTTPNGTAVTTFTVAVQRNYVKQGEERITDFIDCVAWKQTAEYICRNFRKGHGIVIDGTLQTRPFVDKAGNNRKATEVTVNHAWWTIQNPVIEEQGTQYTEADFSQITDDADLPF